MSIVTSGIAGIVKGLHPHALAANNIDVSATAGNILAQRVNSLIGQRTRVLARLSSDSPGHPSSVHRRFQTSFRTGLAANYKSSGNLQTTIVCDMILMPADNTSSANKPRLQWALTDSGATTTTFGELHVNRRTSVAGEIVPDQFFHVTQKWTLKANELYTARLTAAEYARVRSVTIYEEPRSTIYLDPTDPLAGDFAVMPGDLVAKAPIRARSIDDIQETAYNAWKKCGAPIATFDQGSLSDPTTTSLTYQNIFETTSDWSATTPGYWFFPRHRGTFDSNNVPIEARVYARADGTGGTVAFRKAAGVDLATITLTGGGTEAWYTANFNLDASQSAEKVDVLFKSSDGLDVVIEAVSLYEYIA